MSVPCGAGWLGTVAYPALWWRCASCSCGGPPLRGGSPRRTGSRGPVPRPPVATRSTPHRARPPRSRTVGNAPCRSGRKWCRPRGCRWRCDRPASPVVVRTRRASGDGGDQRPRGPRRSCRGRWSETHRPAHNPPTRPQVEQSSPVTPRPESCLVPCSLSRQVSGRGPRPPPPLWPLGRLDPRPPTAAASPPMVRRPCLGCSDWA